MHVRRLWTVLVLTAVISMHGTPALVGDFAAQASTFDDAAVASPSMSMAPAQPDGMVGMLDESGHRSGESHQSGHGVEAHLWAACLAILLAGTALVAAAARLWKGLVAPIREPANRGAWSSRWRFVCRPPDLFALCLLRT